MENKRLSGIRGILLSNFFLKTGFAMVGIFVPLYIYKVTHDFFWILWFYLIFDLTVIILTLPAARLVAKFGSDKVSFLGSLSRSIMLLCLIAAAKNPLFFIPAAILWGAAVPFYWLPFHLSVVGCDHTLAFGQNAAQIDLAAKIGGIAGPALGGLIIYGFGFNALYLVGLGFVILSGIPFFFDKYEFKFPEISFQEMKNNLPVKDMPRLFFGFLGNGLFDRFQAIVWPLYVFLFIGSYRFLGNITSIGLLGSFILLLTAGRLADRFGSKIIKASAPIAIINWLSRALMSGKLSLFLADLVYQLTAVFIWIPFDQINYQTAVQTKKLEYFLSRELTIHFGSFLATLILIFGLGLFGLNWPFAFVLAAASLLLIFQLGLAKEEGIKSVGVVLIRRNDAVLMELRDNKKSIAYPDYWCLPGGKIKIGQSPEQAALKELKKTTGYKAKALNFLTEENYLLPSGKKITRHIFWAEYDQSQEIKCFEGEKMDFLNMIDLNEKQIFPGHQELCQKALNEFIKNNFDQRA